MCATGGCPIRAPIAKSYIPLLKKKLRQLFLSLKNKPIFILQNCLKFGHNRIVLILRLNRYFHHSLPPFSPNGVSIACVTTPLNGRDAVLLSSISFLASSSVNPSFSIR